MVIFLYMAYLVLKGDGFWRKRSALVLRSVKKIKLFGVRRVFRSERYIRKDKVLVFEGEAGSGKTRELLKISKNAVAIYGVEGVYISAVEGFENWLKRAGLDAEELRGLKQFEKAEVLIQKVKGKVVCIDDIDRLDGFKLQVAKRIINSAKVVVVSCSSLKRVNQSIIEELRKKKKLKPFQTLESIDLGKTEVRDVGMIFAIFIVLLFALTWGLTESLILALALRWLVMEGRNDLKRR